MKRIIVLLGALTLLVGCTTTDTGQNSQAPLVVSSGGESVSAPSTGLVQRAGVALTAGDLAQALQAEQFALATAPAGEAVYWQGRKASGSVTAASPYQVGDQNCRQYTQKVVIDGSEHVARGAACRAADGSWALLT